MDLGLREKVCIVTGSTGGIGLEVARQLREEGAVVVTSGRRGGGIGDLHVAVDLAEPGEPERLVAATLERFGRIDCLVNNVGGAEVRSARGADRRRLAALVRAEPDERHPSDAGGAPVAPGAPRGDRQRLVDLRQSGRPRACPSTRS